MMRSRRNKRKASSGKDQSSFHNEEQLIEALRIIKNRKAPIVIHCHHGSDRTGAVCALYRVVFQNVSKEDAIHEMTEGGFGFLVFIKISFGGLKKRI